MTNGAAEDDQKVRGKSLGLDKANVGNNLIQDTMTAKELRRLRPRFVRVEVLSM